MHTDLTPTWESGDARLYLGDCLLIMQSLGKNCADAVITDPPYGIRFKYESHLDTPEGYGEWIWKCVSLAESKCSPGSPIFIWQAMLNIRCLHQWFPREWRLFAACKNFVQMRPTVMQYSFDPVVVWWTPGEAWSDCTANRDWHVGSTTPASFYHDANGKRGHPCARPLNQVKHIIAQWARPDGVVLDCFMDSGTTGVACVQTGRKFIGIEIEPKYFDIAVKRIQEAQQQTRLPL